MADELPTADRDALIEAAYPALRKHMLNVDSWYAPALADIVDALLPHLAVLLDRARQQGRAEQREEYARRSLAARGSQTAPSATENAETGGGA